MTIINLTPHTINYHHNNGEIEIFESMGVARATTIEGEPKEIDGYTIYPPVTFKEVSGLPPFNSGTFYIVSAITAEAADLQGRTTADLLLVHKTIRNEQGQIIGCTAFAQWGYDYND